MVRPEDEEEFQEIPRSAKIDDEKRKDQIGETEEKIKKTILVGKFVKYKLYKLSRFDFAFGILLVLIGATTIILRLNFYL